MSCAEYKKKWIKKLWLYHVNSAETRNFIKIMTKTLNLSEIEKFRIFKVFFKTNKFLINLWILYKTPKLRIKLRF